MSQDYDLSIHSNPDARAWARFFMETYNANQFASPDEEMMVGWFANAMMAIHDHLMTSAPPARGAAQTAIRWMGDDTQDCDVWELTRRRDRFTVLGSPTTLYFKMPNGTQIIVPRGWWVCDVAGDPFISSAAPPPDPTATQPSPGTTETGTRECEAWREQWVAGAAAVYRHEGNTPDRAESRARWLLDVTHGPALPVSRGEASEEEPRDLTCIHGTHEAPICESCFNRRSPSPGSETPRGAEPRCPTSGEVMEARAGEHIDATLARARRDAWAYVGHNGRVFRSSTGEVTGFRLLSPAVTCQWCGHTRPTQEKATVGPCPACDPAPSPSLPGDNHAEKEE